MAVDLAGLGRLIQGWNPYFFPSTLPTHLDMHRQLDRTCAPSCAIYTSPIVKAEAFFFGSRQINVNIAQRSFIKQRTHLFEMSLLENVHLKPAGRIPRNFLVNSARLLMQIISDIDKVHLSGKSPRRRSIDCRCSPAQCVHWLEVLGVPDQLVQDRDDLAESGSFVAVFLPAVQH